MLLLGFILVPLAHTCRLSCVPGDLGDARFNGVILEHFFRWLSGHEHSLISPTFFFPMPGALTFSDNHWGTGWLYSLYRWLGADRYEAFDLLYLGGYVANFFACHLVLRKLGYSPVASAIGAFAFSFAMPVIARHGHEQLAYRFLIPVALLLWQRFRDDGCWHWLGWLALAIAGQFYLSIYLGYFLLLLLSAWVLAQCIVERSWPWRWFVPGLSRGRAHRMRDVILALAMGAVALAAVAWLMYPYLHYSKLYGFQRWPDEIASLLPRLRSYLLADGSVIWGGMGARFVDSMPMRHEQQIFFGAGILGLAAVGLLRPTLSMRWVALLSLVLLVVLTLSVRGHSLYLLLAGLPGVNSIRAVARIGLVLAMPMAILVATGVDSVRERGSLWGVVIAALVMIMVAESASMRTLHYDIEQQRASMSALRRELPHPLPADAILYVAANQERPFYMAELDGMVLGQLESRATLNGYSGNVPPGYGPAIASPPCVQATRRLRAAALFYAERLHASLPQAARGPLTVAGHPECTGMSWAQLPLEDFPQLELRIMGVQPQGDHYSVQVELENHSHYVLDSAPAAQPLRLSWQQLPAGADIDPSAWRSRVEIGDGLDLGPGEIRKIEFTVPAGAAAGQRERLAITMVIEGRAWFHELGVPVLIVPLTAAPSHE
ncbi:hypothetical protein NRY95_03490 [Xanthomonas campestris pv. phormiicola]|nr:hypothetical protein NRY95_03490 [Xanthomonas campestris pv. phormiicola]